MRIFPSELLEPEFYEISDWNNPKDNSTPRWFSIWFVDGQAVAHTSVIEKLRGAL